MVIYAIYQALLTGLRTEAMRRRGQINRAIQIQLVAQTVWASVKEGAAVSAVLAVVLLVFPWMAFTISARMNRRRPPFNHINFYFIPSVGEHYAGVTFPPSARKVDASPSRSLFPPGGLMEQSNASLQRGRQS